MILPPLLRRLVLAMIEVPAENGSMERSPTIQPCKSSLAAQAP